MKLYLKQALAVLIVLFSITGCSSRCSCRDKHENDRSNHSSTIVEERPHDEHSSNEVVTIGSPKHPRGKPQPHNETSPDPPIEADPLLLVVSEKDIPEQLIIRKAYVTSYNKDTRCPNWVGWMLTREHTEGTLKRANDFHEDEEVPVPRATSADYKGSGWTRGHMCPAGDNKWDRQAMYESFSFVNMCPQNANLNNGLWNSMEMDCRKWAKIYGEIYIICGPLFYNQEHETIGENKVAVPEAFFKVILILNPEPKSFGFIAKNTDGGKKSDIYYHSIDEMERITGYDFFSALDDEIEDEVEAEAWKDEI